MRAVTLKVIAGATALIVGGLGISLAVRARHDPGRSLASPRARSSRSGQALVLKPDRVPGRVPRLPVESAPPLTAAPHDPVAAEPLIADPWVPDEGPEAPPLTASPPGALPKAPSVSGRPPARSGMRLPATVRAPAPPVTGALPREGAVQARRVPPVTSPGSLGFREEPAEQRNPVLVMVNCENDTMVVTLAGQKRYRRVLAPNATAQLQIEPGEYDVRVRATKSSPNSGRGLFREYHRYTARWVSVPTGQARPLRLGELNREPEAGVEEEAPLVIPVPEDP